MVGTGSLVIVGNQGSPYSVKMRAYMRFKRIPFRWVPRTMRNINEYRTSPLIIPVLVYPDGQKFTDSTFLIERLEQEFPERATTPTDPAVAFLARLVEDYADEWLTKAMYAGRWHRQSDQDFAEKFIGLSGVWPAPREDGDPMARTFRERQVSRNPLVLGAASNIVLCDKTYEMLLDILEEHFAAGHEFVLGGSRPTSADFGLFGQLVQLGFVDLTTSLIMRKRSPRTIVWLTHVDELSGNEAAADGFPSIDDLPETVIPLLKLIGSVYLKFLVANADAFAKGHKQVTFTPDGMNDPHSQEPFKYQVRCLEFLRADLAKVTGASRAKLQRLLSDTGCWKYLTQANVQSSKL